MAFLARLRRLENEASPKAVLASPKTGKAERGDLEAKTRQKRNAVQRR